MNQQEILEFNKRCAEFMGLIISTNPEDGYDCGTWYEPTENEDEFTPCPVLYHSDWNWIMEVCIAIENLNFRVEIASISCLIYKNSTLVSSFYGIKDKCSKIEATVQAINKFLIWYNQNK